MLALALVLACALLVRADRNVTVLANDPSLKYFPGVSQCDTPCADRFQVCNAGVADCSGYWRSVQPINAMDVLHYTASIPNAAVTLTFQGSAIYYFTTFQTYDSVADIQLDGIMTRGVTWGSSGPIIEVNQSAWSATGLDPTVNHTLSVIYSAINYKATAQPHYLDIDYFVYTMPDSLQSATIALPTRITSSRPGSTMTGPAAHTGAASSDSGSHSNSIAGIVGGTLGGCLLLVLAFLAFLLYRRRKQAPNRVSIVSAGRAAIDDDDRSENAFPAGRAPHVYSYETPPISPVTASPVERLPFASPLRYSTSDTHFRPPYARTETSDHDSSVQVARGSHMGSRDELSMVERRPSTLTASMLGHQSHAPQSLQGERDVEAAEEDTKERALSDIAAHVTNPDDDPAPAYERTV